MTTNKRGRPATGKGPKLYIPLGKVKAVKILKVIPDEKMPLVEAMLEALAEQAKMKKSQKP
ncbi:MAG: hypothetical protein N3E45_00850 [Oscillatoriaceae bacterium SKW80]|nr:hypothetical protein [Oscillatoriaceae bacterium SKYG93]MCX8119377.1 hypothetical protein [Oscillatoriaceae bacterium SKW80]MDW8454844.1 hypothetical protein [Oscillatoriaceae cyanobacterium SKYGB_i_bin93]HIK28377.1 hypothetical protein [Oscillatoriaceae cyanobacterium M7585_C2015_266]